MDSILSIFTATLALAAFMLSVINFRLTGAFIRVRALPGMTIMQAENDPDRGPTVSVTASNIGRSSVQVTHLGFTATDTGQQFLSPWAIGAPIPCTIDGLHQQTWAIYESALREKLTNPASPIRPYVLLANGKRRTGKSFRLDADRSVNP
jgi:hypothetical protein